MSPKVELGLSHTSNNGFIHKWEADRHWLVSYKSNINEVWAYKVSGSGWPLLSGDESMVKGAALVAPLSILFWEDE